MKISELRKEYEEKKDRIKERLNQFNIFFREPYSWFYENNDINLRRVNSPENVRIFEELCFCIFTANTSAEMSAKAVDSTRDVLFNGTKEDIKNRLIGIYRFNNVRPSYILHTRNYLIKTVKFALKKKIVSFNDKQKLRDFFAMNKDIKGLGMKESSHFLRNLGFKGYAILDKHIINSLNEFAVFGSNARPKNRKEYLEMEDKFREFSEHIGINVDELDLLLWSMKNGRILK